MEVLTLNGKQYVKASKVAKDLGYASDYVGQLCRSGAVDAHLVGRTWYVNPDTVGAHRIEKKRNARTKAREYAKKSIEEARMLTIKENAKGYKNIAIHYEKDRETLIPEVKKLPILTAVTRLQKPYEEKDTPSYSIENESKKIIMSGVIPVRDAELEETYTDTVVLEAKIQKSHKKPLIARPKVEEIDEEEEVVEGVENNEVESKVPLTFLDKLEALEDTPNIRKIHKNEEVAKSVVNVVPDERLEQEKDVEPKVSETRFPYLLVQIVCGAVFIISLLSLFIDVSYEYTEESYDTSISLSSHIIEKI